MTKRAKILAPVVLVLPWAVGTGLLHVVAGIPVGAVVMTVLVVPPVGFAIFMIVGGSLKMLWQISTEVAQDLDDWLYTRKIRRKQ